MLLFEPAKRGDPQLRVIARIVILGMALLLVGLYYVQVVSAKRYRANLADQSYRIVRMPAIRGKILDRNGIALAENRPSYNVNLYFEELRRSFRYEYTNRVLREFGQANPDVKARGSIGELLQSRARYYVVSNLMNQVSTVIGQSGSLDEKQFTNHYNQQRSLPFPIVRDLSPPQIARFVEQGKRPPSLALEVQAVRNYPYKTAAAHLLGHLKRDDDPVEEEEISFQFRLPDYVGVMGLELAFDQQLRGQAGVKSVLVNNLQYRQAEEIWTPSRPGQNVVLTLDLPVQLATEEALKTTLTEPRGAAVVMDCHTGDILAMASIPAFDPNVFTARLPDEDWEKLNDESLRPLFNRATYGVYPPGSIFKAIVGLAALEAGTLRPDETFVSKGYYQIEGRGHPWHCTAPAGPYEFYKAFYLSCNCYFIDYGLRTGYERIVDMGRHFGLGRRTGLSSRLEASGYFPDPMDKIKKNGSRWMAGDTANLCIGQGDITVTPLQMAVMTAAIANGGKVLEPRLVDRIEPQEKGDNSAEAIHFPPGQIRDQLKLTPANLDLVRNAMLMDVEHTDDRGRPDGTGRLAAVKDMRVCGKTGTAQVMEGRTVKSYVTWFVSFAPFETPRYAVVVVMETEHGSGASTCAPVAHEIYEALLKRERGLLLRPKGSLAAN